MDVAAGAQERRPSNQSLQHNGLVQNLVQKLHLRKIDGFLHSLRTQDCCNLSLPFKGASTTQNGTVESPVCCTAYTARTRLCGKTGMSNTLSMN